MTQYATGVKPDKMQPVSSTGKSAPGTKSEKACNRCQVQENVQLQREKV